MPAMGSSERGLLRNVVISTDWTSVELSLLKELLVIYASDSRQSCYGKISKELQDKTSRDVACYCQWMTRKQNGGSSRKQNNKREKITEVQVKPSSHATDRANSLPSSSSMDTDDGNIYKVIGGEVGKLLEENAKTLDQISANFSALKVHENKDLFRQARNNIDKIWKELNDMSKVTKQMPPLPVKLNEELANFILR